MPFANYSDLQASILDWMNRPDLDVECPDFIRLAEIGLQRKMKIRFTEKEVTGTFPGAQDYLTLPADLIEPRYLRLDTTPLREVQIVGPQKFRSADNAYSTSYPVVGMHQGSRLMLKPTPDATINYTLWYWGGLPMLSEDAPTNWLLTNGFDVLLHASLVEGFDYIEDDAAKAKWAARLNDSFPQLRNLEWRARLGGGPLRVQTDVDVGGTPRRV